MKSSTWATIGKILATVVAIAVAASEGILAHYYVAKDAALVADIYPVNYEHPRSIIEDAIQSEFDAFTRGLIEADRWKSDRQKLGTVIDGLVSDFLKLDRSYHRDAQFRTRGFVRIHLANQGEIPAKEVRVSVKNLKYFIVEDGQKTKAMQARNNVIEISTRSQREHTVILAWTDGISGYDRWSIEDDFKVSHSNGIGEINLHIPATGIPRFYDRYESVINLLAMYFFFIGIPLLIAIFSSGSKKRTAPTTDKAIGESPVRENK